MNDEGILLGEPINGEALVLIPKRSGDLLGYLRGFGMTASGPRSSTPGARHAFVTTREFLLGFGARIGADMPEPSTN
ncbi:hypothetical protein [Mesorhizobium sp. M0045]|uniref:hypothetical protein n=1 Tax=Mesorhizobium sp. M0045 TaxID=2956857 RepID=UPI00333CDB00